jgi:hypothetical protein
MKKPSVRCRTYRSGVFTAAASDFMQFFILIILLPYAAYISASAILTSLYRMLISKRNLLKWVTAAESESRRGRGLGLYYRKLFICPAAAAGAFCLAPSPPPLPSFFLWLAAPALGYALGRERKSEARVGAENRPSSCTARATYGGISSAASAPSETGCRRTIFRRSRSRLSRSAPLRRISG